ncbi:hypothetical protein UA3_02306 [Enterococcus faecium EnGen0263]|uniref:hypothetical protein n=1 Tax=Enterococcus faecium TaxID=1352 RepID=UPI0003304B65|nr:hypothetical protein [Enterococcus faecium]EOH54287.1 hypothetical protein UA3_02306 [Enterococcus faecium EnGen0263]
MKKLFAASFEQSLNLLDDPFVTFMNKDVNRLPDPQGGRKIFARGIGTLLILFLVGINFLIAFISTKGSEGELGESTVLKPDINFLPIELFYVLFLLWIILVIIFRDKGEYYLSRIKGQFNINLYIVWLLLEVNLLFITFFLKPLTLIGMSLLISILVLVGYIVFRTKKRSLENVLYETEKEKDKIDKLVEKVLKLVMKYGWLVVIIVALWKLIFPSSNEVRTDLVGFIGILGMWLAMDIAVIIVEAYLFFPYLLHGYYKYKYPEEYREWEGKTQLEWYGEKYFNKNIKGTEKEVNEEQ